MQQEESYQHDRGFHRIIDGVAVRTDKARERAKHIQFRSAGIPELLLDDPVESLAKKTVWSNPPKLQLGKGPNIYWIYASSTNQRMLNSWVYLLKYGIGIGTKARYVSMQELIDAQFDNEEKRHWREEIRTLDVLVIDLTNLANHKLLPTLLADIHAQRSRTKSTTMYLSDDDIGSMPMKYGEPIASIFHNRTGICRIAPKSIKP